MNISMCRFVNVVISLCACVCVCVRVCICVCEIERGFDIYLREIDQYYSIQAHCFPNNKMIKLPEHKLIMFHVSLHSVTSYEGLIMPFFTKYWWINTFKIE